MDALIGVEPIHAAGRQRHVVNLRHAMREGFALRAQERLFLLLRRRRRNDFLDERHRRILEDARRAPFRVAHDLAARRRRRIRVNARELQRQRVCEHHVAVGPHDENGMIARHRIDPPPRRQFAAPKLMVPIAVENPFALRARRRVVGDAPDEFLFRRSAGKIDARKAKSAEKKMCVIVDKARRDKLAAEVDDLGRFTMMAVRAFLIADEENLVACYRDGALARRTRNARPDIAIEIDDVRRKRRRRARAGRQDQRQRGARQKSHVALRLSLVRRIDRRDAFHHIGSEGIIEPDMRLAASKTQRIEIRGGKDAHLQR